MKQAIIITSLCVLCFTNIQAQVKSVSADMDWKQQQAVLKNTIEAEYIIRVGDVDNLGFGWPEGFDPFCGRMTESHPYPWDINPADLPGFDRILLSSKYDPEHPNGCSGDGYSGSYDKVKTKPVPWSIPTDALKGATIHDAYLQLFIDDFQAPTQCSRFEILINNKHFTEGEKILNSIDQSGPVGKLITLPLPEEFYDLLQNNSSVTLLIDETTGAADGFAVDFLRLLVNRKRENSCRGNVRGFVYEKDSDNKPVKGAKVFTPENIAVNTNADGSFEIKDIPAGFEVLGASAPGYMDGSGTADIGPGNDNAELIIYLSRGKSAKYNDKNINVGESVTLNNILFDQGKSLIKNESKPELDKLLAFLQANPNAEIELSGHTSSEGESAYNHSLSYKRVKSCRDYLVAKGIAEDRIIAIGLGPDRPVAPNDTEANRAKNRRVEMRLKKL